LPPSEGNWTLYVCAVDVVGNIGYAVADYYYHIPLAITSLTPNKGPTTGSTEITITGQKFIYNGETAESTLATLTVILAVDGDASPAACTVKTLTATEIVCITTSHQVGLVDITVNNGTESHTLENGYLYVETNLTLLVDNVKLTVSPAAGAETGYTVATVTTNSPTGYSLLMVANGTDLVCLSDPTQKIPSITTNGNLIDDSWGYGLGSFDSSLGIWSPPTSNAWRKVPVGGSGDTIGSSTAPSEENGDLFGVYFGVKVSHTTPACADYQQSLTITLEAQQ
jgi:hypothetical protein